MPAVRGTAWCDVGVGRGAAPTRSASGCSHTAFLDCFCVHPTREFPYARSMGLRTSGLCYPLWGIPIGLCTPPSVSCIAACCEGCNPALSLLPAPSSPCVLWSCLCSCWCVIPLDSRKSANTAAAPLFPKQCQGAQSSSCLTFPCSTTGC